MSCSTPWRSLTGLLILLGPPLEWPSAWNPSGLHARVWQVPGQLHTRLVVPAPSLVPAWSEVPAASSVPRHPYLQLQWCTLYTARNTSMSGSVRDPCTSSCCGAACVARQACLLPSVQIHCQYALCQPTNLPTKRASVRHQRHPYTNRGISTPTEAPEQCPDSCAFNHLLLLLLLPLPCLPDHQLDAHPQVHDETRHQRPPQESHHCGQGARACGAGGSIRGLTMNRRLGTVHSRPQTFDRAGVRARLATDV